MDYMKRYWKWVAVVGLALIVLNFLGSCSSHESREAREMERSPDHNRQWWEPELKRDERPAIGDWKTDVFRGNGGK